MCSPNCQSQGMFMRITASLLPLLCCQVLLPWLTPVQACDSDSIQHCVAPMEKYAEEALAIFPTYDDDSLKLICGHFEQMKICLRPLKKSCTKEDLVELEGVEDACDFLCNAGFEGYRQHRYCFGKSQLHREGNVCNSSYNKHMVSLFNEQSVSLAKKRDKACKITYELLNCIHAAVEQYCGQAAADWIHTINKMVLTPTLDEFGCYADHKIGIAVIFGTALGLFSVLLTIIITSIVCRRHQRRASVGFNRLGTLSSVISEKRPRTTEASVTFRRGSIDTCSAGNHGNNKRTVATSTRRPSANDTAERDPMLTSTGDEDPDKDSPNGKVHMEDSGSPTTDCGWTMTTDV